MLRLFNFSACDATPHPPPSGALSDPLEDYLSGHIRVPPLAFNDGCRDTVPLNWWLLDIGADTDRRDPKSPWATRPSPIKDDNPSTSGSALAADACSPFYGDGGKRHMLPRSSLPPSSAGRFEFAALKNALRDEDDESDDELDGISNSKAVAAAAAAGTPVCLP
jgi:hypothetical protein